MRFFLLIIFVVQVAFIFGQDSLFTSSSSWYCVNQKDSGIYIHYHSFDHWEKIDSNLTKFKFKEDHTFKQWELGPPEPLSDSDKRSEKITGIKIPKSRAIVDYMDGDWRIEGQFLILILNKDQEVKYLIQNTKKWIRLVP